MHKTTWKRKRKLADRMKTLRACRRPKITSSGSDDSPLNPVVSSVDSVSAHSNYHLCTDNFTEASSFQHAVPSSGCEETVMQFAGEERNLLPQNNDLSASTPDPPQSELEESFTVSLGAQIDSEEPSSSSDSDDERMTADESKSIWKKWLQEQPKDSLKMLSIMLTDTYIERFGLTKTNAAKESALLLGMNEKTIRTWRKSYYANMGKFSDSKQGKHSRPYILDDEKLRHDAATWVRSNASKKGEANMTAAKFCEWVNAELLPNASVPPGCPLNIKPRTAVKWLHDLGFRPQMHKKGIYIDGHERSDVVEYRNLFLRKLDILEQTHLPPPSCSDGLTQFNVGNPEFRKHLVLIYHDECIFHANEGESILWAEEGKIPIRPKTQGRGLMVSDFVTEHDGLLALTDEEYIKAHEYNSRISKYACQIIKYGVSGDGYWNNEKFLKQVKKAIEIAKFKYPAENFTLVWLFDQSSGHCAYKDDALNVNKMNVKPGGAQPKMRDTEWNGEIQTMVLPDGRPKGMKLILEERKIDTEGMVAADMRLILRGHDDFKYEKTALEYLMANHGQRCYYIPKFHCELNPIERVWGAAKQYTRRHCDYSFPGLEGTVPIGLASVELNTIRKYFRKCREYMQAYRDGKTGGDSVEKAVKQYKSHRRIFDTV